MWYSAHDRGCSITGRQWSQVDIKITRAVVSQVGNDLDRERERERGLPVAAGQRGNVLATGLRGCASHHGGKQDSFLPLLPNVQPLSSGKIVVARMIFSERSTYSASEACEQLLPLFQSSQVFPKLPESSSFPVAALPLLAAPSRWV
jgi:hypothetical protein